MELVKRVDVQVDALGKLVFTENEQGNAEIFRGKVTRENFKSISRFCAFFQSGCPSIFRVSNYMSGKVGQISVYFNQDIKIEFEVELNDKGIFGYHEVEGHEEKWRNGRHQIFFYHWNAEINSMKLFQNVFSNIQFKPFEENPLTILKKIYPDAENVWSEEYGYLNKKIYCVRYGDKNSDNSRKFAFEYDKKTGNFKMLGILYYTDYGSEITSMSNLENSIKRAEESIEDILAMEEIMTEAENIIEEPEKPWYQEGRDYEQAKLEANKADLPRLRARERNPELASMSVHKLLHWLDCYRKSNGYDWSPPYSRDDIKTELLYRPHVPRGAERKVARRLKAQGITQLPDKNSRTSKKKNGK